MLNYMSDKKTHLVIWQVQIGYSSREMHKSTLYLLPLHEIWQSVLSCTSQ